MEIKYLRVINAVHCEHVLNFSSVVGRIPMGLVRFPARKGEEVTLLI